MAVTKDVWKDLDWKARIAVVMESLGVSKKSLAKKIGVSRKTLYCWERNLNKPTAKYERILTYLGVKSEFNDAKEESYMAMHTLSTDASAQLLQNASFSSDPVMVAMATNCIAIKQAAILTAIDSQRLVIRIVSLYGKTLRTTLQIQSTCHPVEKRAAEITIGRAGDDGIFIISTELISGSTSSKFAFTVSDRAMTVTAKRITNFLL
jgi:DNA-binding XRE family transcriptional regulator